MMLVHGPSRHFDAKRKLVAISEQRTFWRYDDATRRDDDSWLFLLHIRHDLKVVAFLYSASSSCSVSSPTEWTRKRVARQHRAGTQN